MRSTEVGMDFDTCSRDECECVLYTLKELIVLNKKVHVIGRNKGVPLWKVGANENVIPPTVQYIGKIVSMTTRRPIQPHARVVNENGATQAVDCFVVEKVGKAQGSLAFRYGVFEEKGPPVALCTIVEKIHAV